MGWPIWATTIFPTEPGTHLCSGTTEPSVTESLLLSPLSGIVSHHWVHHLSLQSNQLPHEGDDINNHTDPNPYPFRFPVSSSQNSPEVAK